MARGQGGSRGPAGHPVVTGTSGRENILPNRPAESWNTPSQAAPVGQHPPALPAHGCWPHSEPRPQAWKRHLCPAHGSGWSNTSRLPRPHTVLRGPESRPTAHTHSPCPSTHALPTSRPPRRGSVPPAAALTAALPVCLLTVCLSLDIARGWSGEGDVDGSHSVRLCPAVSPAQRGHQPPLAA